MLRYLFAALIACLLVFHPKLVAAQPSVELLVEDGIRHLQAARSKRTNELYQAAEDAFTAALTQNAHNGRALVHRGEARIGRGVITQQRSTAEAIKLFQAGMSDMDTAVSEHPNSLDVRITRGLTYLGFPEFYNKQPVAFDDLTAAVSLPEFAELPTPLADRVRSALERLRTLRAAGPSTPRRDRFPAVSADTTPVIAAASATFEAHRSTSKPEWIAYALSGLQASRGLLATHTVESVDHPGMFIIFTWWENKQALNDFYYSDVHQQWMRGRGAAASSDSTSQQHMPSQLGIELLTSLPGGAALGGGFVPRQGSSK